MDPYQLVEKAIRHECKKSSGFEAVTNFKISVAGYVSNKGTHPLVSHSRIWIRSVGVRRLAQKMKNISRRPWKQQVERGIRRINSVATKERNKWFLRMLTISFSVVRTSACMLLGEFTLLCILLYPFYKNLRVNIIRELGRKRILVSYSLEYKTPKIIKNDISIKKHFRSLYNFIVSQAIWWGQKAFGYWKSCGQQF